MNDYFPQYYKGKVCKGFGRGSKDLGIPTANFDNEVVDSLPEGLVNGVYYGWCQVDSSPIYPAAISIGWNPFYQNKKRSFEVHIIHKFDEDFYESDLKVIVMGYIRPERNFSSKGSKIVLGNKTTVKFRGFYIEQFLGKISKMMSELTKTFRFSRDELIDAIHSDIEQIVDIFKSEFNLTYKFDKFFDSPNQKCSVHLKI